MNLLNELQNITDAPCDETPIIIVWYDENLDIPRHFLRVCRWHEKTNHYLYTSDNDFAFEVPNKNVLGWCYL